MRYWMVVGALLALGCDDGDQGASLPDSCEAHQGDDAFIVDAARPDMAQPDMALIETPDAAVRDAAPDAGAFDVGVSQQAQLEEHCEERVGEARIEEIAPDLFVAIGYDLANTIVLRTPDGNVVIDVGMSPARSQVVRDAFADVAPGPTLAIIYTHSHIDHTGGASVWADEGTQIWATDALLKNLVKQYGAFRPVEQFRGNLQFGQHLDDAHLPCSSIGRRADVEAALTTGIRLPTDTFSGQATVEVGGATLELIEAHGETEDQLFVWIPSLSAVLPGDNFYQTFPNLYTIRGTSPRPVGEWIRSLDKMRARSPSLLVPSHTTPIEGAEAVAAALTNYRDGIQWIRDSVVRGANAGTDVDTLAQQIGLPEHLAETTELQPLYGQIDWSVRGIYDGNLGWFDGRPERLYPPRDPIAREVRMMGGPGALVSEAQAALNRGDARWAAHLLGKLRDSGLGDPEVTGPIMAQALEAIGGRTENTNGRAYLLESAKGLREGFAEQPEPTLDDTFVEQLPISVVFDVMPSRLRTSRTANVHQSITVELTDLGVNYVLTVRRGVLEVVRGEPLPGTPAPASVVTTTSVAWKRLTLGLVNPLDALNDGSIEVSDLPAMVGFFNYFEAGI